MKRFLYLFGLLALGVSHLLAAPMALPEALALAGETEALKGKGHRLYSLTAEVKGDEAFYALTFFDGESQLLSVNVDGEGQTRSQVREATKISLFEQVDFSTLPSCEELCAAESIEAMVAEAKRVIVAVGLSLDERDSMRLNYHVRRSKVEGQAVHHCWSVTLPTDGERAAVRVGFIDGKFSSLNPAKLR